MNYDFNVPPRLRRRLGSIRDGLGIRRYAHAVQTIVDVYGAPSNRRG